VVSDGSSVSSWESAAEERCIILTDWLAVGRGTEVGLSSWNSAYWSPIHNALFLNWMELKVSRQKIMAIPENQTILVAPVPSVNDTGYQLYSNHLSLMCASLLKREYATYWPSYEAANIKRKNSGNSFETMTLNQLCDAKKYKNNNPPADPLQSKISFTPVASSTTLTGDDK